MCGFFGVLSPNHPPQAGWLENISESIAHRGPNDFGTYIDTTCGMGMVHRRLSILDLSIRGHQPMFSQSGRYVIAYNGEIYNHIKIRDELVAQRSELSFLGGSDTETLLAAIEHWGIENALRRLNGMFAFALWDIVDKRLWLARDRMGEKPLYVGWIGNGIVFSSELKPILRTFPWSIEPSSIPTYVSLGYIPAPISIVKGVYKLFPATYLCLSADDSKYPKDIQSFSTSLNFYWSLYDQDNCHQMGKKGFSSALQLTNELSQLLGQSVQERMLSDVPLGACLSGGIDSSLVAAIMQSESMRKVQTFTVGFEEDTFDESGHARSVANHLGTDHTEVILQAKDALELIPKIPSVYDEPFADPSQIPTLLVSKALKSKVTVALSGDGGDELFYGYGRYQTALQLWRYCGWLPAPARKAVAQHSNRLIFSHYRFWRLSQRMAAPNFDAFYLAFGSVVPNPTILLPGSTPIWSQLPALKFHDPIPEAHMMHRDLSQYLPDDILTKVDRASMSEGLEMRAPFLDHRVVEWAWALPIDYKLHKGKSKWILRQILKRYLPEALFERPKQGFTMPIDDWLRGPLSSWAEQLLTPRSIERCVGLNTEVITRLWINHRKRKINAGFLLWNVLMLLAWHEEWGK